MSLTIKPQWLLAGAALAVVGFGLYAWKKGGMAGAAQSIGSGAVAAVDGLVGGAVQGVGSIFGIPQTDPDKCAQARASGDLWAASMYCPAAQFAAASFDAVGGLLQGAGTLVGVPKTNMTECEKAKAEGRTLDASFACSAGDFLRYLWN